MADDRPPLRSGALGEDDRVLAFDTSGPIGSVVVAAGPEVLAREVLTQMGAHASALLPAIDHVLEAAGVDRGQLRGVIVGEGPGSFTGVRVAAATAKGLGHALGIPVWAVSSLAAAALASAPGPVRYVLFDARGERVYGACYGVGGASFEEMIPPHAGELRDVLDGDVPAGAVFLGDGAVRHRGVIKGAGFPVVEAVGAQTLADGLVTYVARACPAPVSDLAAWEPEYVRASSAERLWRS